MPPANRNEPRRAKSSSSDYSVIEFLRDFPDDAACLDYLWRTRHSADGEHAHCPRCDCERVFRRYATKQQRQSWTLHGLRASRPPDRRNDLPPLLYLAAAVVPRDVPDDQHSVRDLRQTVERELGVHYKTAWPMFNKIRTELMNDDDEPQLRGEVEIDETSWCGRPRNPIKDARERARWRENRTTVLGMIERGGRIRLRVIESRRGEPLSRAVRTHVNPSAFMLTDDWPSYKPLWSEYAWATINHSAGIYVEGDVHTNSIEGFFGNLKTGMRGAYKHVSDEYLQSYLDEYAWRHNHRHAGHRSMFHELVGEAARQ